MHTKLIASSKNDMRISPILAWEEVVSLGLPWSVLTETLTQTQKPQYITYLVIDQKIMEITPYKSVRGHDAILTLVKKKVS